MTTLWIRRPPDQVRGKLRGNDKKSGNDAMVVCNTINAWWLLEVALSHPQARPDSSGLT